MGIPEIDRRSKEDLLRAIALRAAAYTPEWRFDRDDPDLGTALALIYAQLFALSLIHILPAPRREEREGGVAGRRETPAPAAPLLFSLIRTAPALAGQAARRAQARGERTPPPSRPFEEAGPALELRRDRGAEIIQQTARQAVERRVELAVERQEPQLRLLRRQSQEQERALEQQKSALHDLKEQMERQQTLVRRAMERTAAPGMEEPAQVRRLARAVMKELEGQLRLERQRRGLS